jgi:hypothetical protein
MSSCHTVTLETHPKLWFLIPLLEKKTQNPAPPVIFLSSFLFTSSSSHLKFCKCYITQSHPDTYRKHEELESETLYD